MRNRCRLFEGGVFGGVQVCEKGGSPRRIQHEACWPCGCDNKPRHEDRRSHDAVYGRVTMLPEKGTRCWIKRPYAAQAKLSSNDGTPHIEPRPIPSCSSFISTWTRVAPCNRRRRDTGTPDWSPLIAPRRNA